MDAYVFKSSKHIDMSTILVKIVLKLGNVIYQ